MDKIKLVLLMGGSSSEREVSLMTGEKIIANLDKNKYDFLVINVPKDSSNEWIKNIIDFKPKIVFNALHGGPGENGSVQGLLDCLNIPYVGTKVLGSAIGMDKYLSKIILKARHIPVPDDVFIGASENVDIYIESIRAMGFPVVVKPNLGGSSIGITIVKEEKDLFNAVKIVQDMKDDVLIEKFIDGKEVTCGIIEDDKGISVMPVLDIGTNEGFYDYNAKYVNINTEIYFSTLPEFLQVMIKEIAKKTFKILKCTGYARVDMIVHEEQVYVLEVNTIPGMTSRSLIPFSLEKNGESFGEFLDDLINFELHKV